MSALARAGAKVVLGAGAAERRVIRVAGQVDLDLALAAPGIGVPLPIHAHPEGGAQETAAACDLGQDRVVVSQPSWHFLVVERVEITDRVRQIVVDCVVDVIIEHAGCADAVVVQHHTHRPAKGHRHGAKQAAALGAGKQCAGKRDHAAQAHTEKIAARHVDGRLSGVIPEE